MTFECEPGHADRAEARGDSRHRRHASQPRRRELQRRDPRAQRPRASLAGDRPGLRVRALARLPADQHRSHCRHARRDGRELARLHREDARAPAGQRDHLPDGAAVQHDHQRQPAERHRTIRAAGGGLVRRSVAGCGEAFEALEADGYTSAAPTPPSRIRPARASSTPIACGRGRTWWGSAWRRSVTSMACTCRTSIRGRPTPPPFDATRSRSIAPIVRRDEERLIREFILQLKLGSIRPAYFRDKYRVERPASVSASQLDSIAADGYLAERGEQRVALTREGLLRVDGLLKRFFLPAARGHSIHVRRTGSGARVRRGDGARVQCDGPVVRG